MNAVINHRLGLKFLSKHSFMLVFFLLSSCAIGPDFHRPEKPHSVKYTAKPMPKTTVSAQTTLGSSQTFAMGEALPKHWWTIFHSDALNQLVKESLCANPDMAAARESLKIAHANTRIQQTAFFPLVTGNYNPSRQLTAGTLASNLASNAYLYNLNTLNFNVTYMPDVLGFTRRQVETARSQEESQFFQNQAVYLTLASNVVLGAIQEAALREQIKVTKQMIDLASDMLRRFKQELALGAVAESDVVAQAAFLAQMESALPPLELKLTQQRHLLSSLRGVSTSKPLSQTFELKDFTLPTHLPVSLPSQLVEQRPDVRAAEADLHAASAQIGVAMANRLPNLMLSGNTGLMPVVFSAASVPASLPLLATGGSQYWAIGANLLGTLFDSGSLLYQQRQAEAAYRVAEAQYRRVVLNAFQNVADALKAVEYDAKTLKLVLQQERTAFKNLSITQNKLKLGVASNLEVIQAQELYEQALANLAQSQANRLADTVGLFQALGGGMGASLKSAT